VSLWPSVARSGVSVRSVPQVVPERGCGLVQLGLKEPTSLPRRFCVKEDVGYFLFADHSALLEFGQNGERRLHRTLRWFVNTEHAAQVNYIQHIHSQVAKIVVNLRSQFLARKSRNL
jgi:hypothetical protein